MLLFYVSWTQNPRLTWHYYSPTLSLSSNFPYTILFLLLPIRTCSFAHAIAITINVLLCRVKYSLLAIVLHPATRCSTVSPHSRHLPFKASPLATFHTLVSTICSTTVFIDAVFLGVNLCFNQRWHSCSCLLYMSLCNSFC